MSEFVDVILDSFKKTNDLKNFVGLFPDLSFHHILHIETTINVQTLSFLDENLVKVIFLRGNKESETLYKDGSLYGLTEWFADGTKASEAEYVEGIRRRYREWWENGNLHQDVHYLNGRMEGNFASWYPNGTLNSSGTYHNGLREGIWTINNTTLEFHNDVLIS